MFKQTTYTWMFTAAWFITVKQWKHHQCPSLTNDSTRCGIFIQRIMTQLQERHKYWNMLQHGSTLKTSSKRSQKQKAIYYLTSFKWNVQNRQIHRDINQTSDCHSMRKGTAQWIRGFILQWWTCSGTGQSWCQWLHNFVNMLKASEPHILRGENDGFYVIWILLNRKKKEVFLIVI